MKPLVKCYGAWTLCCNHWFCPAAHGLKATGGNLSDLACHSAKWPNRLQSGRKHTSLPPRDAVLVTRLQIGQIMTAAVMLAAAAAAVSAEPAVLKKHCGHCRFDGSEEGGVPSTGCSGRGAVANSRGRRPGRRNTLPG